MSNTHKPRLVFICINLDADKVQTFKLYDQISHLPAPFTKVPTNALWMELPFSTKIVPMDERWDGKSFMDVVNSNDLDPYLVRFELGTNS